LALLMINEEGGSDDGEIIVQWTMPILW
jgi:hypothetical protein